jgi:tripartite-type tricarboxylate transporter receptor subunit TctC
MSHRQVTHQVTSHVNSNVASLVSAKVTDFKSQALPNLCKRGLLKTWAASGLCGVTGLGLWSSGLQAQTNDNAYPMKAIRLIVPFAVGGSGDLIARVVADKLASHLNQAVVIDNKGGNGSILGTDMASKAQPDGYTLVLSNGAAITVGPLMGQTMSYKPLEDLVHIALLGTFTNALIVRSDHPAKNLADFIALARDRPGRLSYSSAGVGSAGFLTGELLKHLLKIDMVHIPYKGTGPAMTDLLGGQIDAMFNALIAATPYIKAGKVRALAVTASERLPDHLDIPTLTESVPGAVGDAWFGISAPAKTPAAVVERLRLEIGKSLDQAELKTKLMEMGLTPKFLGTKDFYQFIVNENKKWAGVIKTDNLSAN